MTTHVLKNVSPGHLARVLAILYGGFFGVMAIISMPMLFLAPAPVNNGPPIPRAIFMVLLLLYPLLGAFFGWINGHILARLYNFVARRFGGLQYESEII